MTSVNLESSRLDDAGRELLARLAALPLGPEHAGLSFEGRLARDNAWSLNYAKRVCDEYRRFVFLCHVTGRPLTPSDEVDQAWHLHLCYSRSYWDRMCRGVLGRPLHHEPTKGGSSEAAKFVDWYGATLDEYEATFGEAPPADIWPPSRARFATAASFRRVNVAEHWVISRASMRRLVRISAALVLICVSLAGCVWAGGETRALWIFGLCVVVVAVGSLLAKLLGRGGGGGGSGCGAGCGDAGCGGGCGGGCGS